MLNVLTYQVGWFACVLTANRKGSVLALAIAGCIVAIWLVFAMLIGVAASHRGRSGVAWFFLATILSPLIAILILVKTDLARHPAITSTLSWP